jgi:hypothetical protein
MTIGRRYELLMANAAHNIPDAQRKALLEAATRWMESPACPARGHEELFYLWGAMTGIQMANYCEELQTQWGGQMIEEALKK